MCSSCPWRLASCSLLQGDESKVKEPLVCCFCLPFGGPDLDVNPVSRTRLFLYLLSKQVRRSMKEGQIVKWASGNCREGVGDKRLCYFIEIRSLGWNTDAHLCAPWVFRNDTIHNSLESGDEHSLLFLNILERIAGVLRSETTFPLNCLWHNLKLQRLCYGYQSGSLDFLEQQTLLAADCVQVPFGD